MIREQSDSAPPHKPKLIRDEIRHRRFLLAGLIDCLLQRDGDSEAYLDDLNAAELLLQTLPLATETYGAAMNRLRNARRYLESREIGAARFELRLLASMLKRAWEN